MNKFHTEDDGGLPLKLDDFRWFLNALENAFKGLLSPFGVTDQYAFILSGCNRSVASGTVTIAEGFISIGGEICYVPAHSYSEPSPGNYEYWVINETNDSSGNKEFQSGINYDTYKVRVGKISVSNSVPAGHVEYVNTQDISDRIRSIINTGDWLFLGDDDDFYGTPGSTPVAERRYAFKTIEGFIHLRGGKVLDDITIPTDVTIDTLPVGYRPPVQINLTHVIWLSTTTARFCKLAIKTNGDIVLYQFQGSAQFWLNDIPAFRV